jgi:hypothetical protein
MKRDNTYGTTLSVVGVLTLPFFIGIPLLATGILLLARGERIRTERWIRALFRLVLAALLAALALALAFLLGEARSAESGIARSILCFAPVCLAILLSLAMAALTAARFPDLSPKYRVLGLGFGALFAVAACIALALAFPWQAAGTAGVSVVAWACMRWRRIRRVRSSRGMRES